LILACDLPFITTEFLSFLSGVHQTDKSHWVTIPVDQSNRDQPLAAIYDQRCRAAVERMLANDELKLDLLFGRAPARRVAFAEFAHLPGAERLFTNINTPEEHQALQCG
jgi:molybdopterin-guanine dinucleotide biosynthesis protein A